MHGLYLHIPFCARKCPYCDFYSLGGASSSLKEEYAAALCRQIRRFGESGLFSGPENRFDTLYIGGGTPPLLGERLLDGILEAAFSSFSFLSESEITLEANPETLTQPLLAACRNAGVNRLSIGLQSGVEKEQKLLGRRHGNREVLEALENALALGYKNCSADVMLALPGQETKQLDQTVSFLSQLPLQHLSAYLLKIEPGTPFANQNLSLPSEDQAADQYLAFCDAAEKMGFVQYEISNFARPGFESRHNLNYWNCGTYLGLGPGAHSFFQGKRWFYSRDLKDYLSHSHCLWMPEEDGPGGDLEEYLMLRLRLTQGAPFSRLQQDWGISPAQLKKARLRLRPLEEGGLLQWEPERVALTRQGFLVSNGAILAVIEAFA